MRADTHTDRRANADFFLLSEGFLVAMALFLLSAKQNVRYKVIYLVLLLMHSERGKKIFFFIMKAKVEIS